MGALTALDEDQQLFADSVFGWATQHIGPHVAAMDENAQFHDSIVPGLFEMGLMGIEVPEQYGGAGADIFTACLAIEALARVDPAVSVLCDVQNTLVNNALFRWGTDEQKERILPKMCTEWVGSYCLSEAGSGSDAFALRCKAERRGDKWVLNGTKLWITNAKEASIFLILANTDFDKGYKGITAFLVYKDNPGLSLGKKEDKLGIRASSTCEVILEDCEVSDADVLGAVGVGYKVAIETLNEGRIGIGAQMIGLAQGAFDYAMNYIMEREQFGKPVASFQGMQFQYAQLATEIEAARLLVYNAAQLKMAGRPFLKEAAMAKLYTSRVAEQTASMCIEFMGGVGFTKEYAAEKFYRDAKIGSIYEGTSNMQLMTIAKLLTAEYAK
ncbi:MAG: alkylation response protein AidB-like acyl-CoA dehydrogenase [Bradymonadia bacterium]|jgi:alkylation response protein AidB-like acyl-CoA dehydrogenase